MINRHGAFYFKEVNVELPEKKVVKPKRNKGLVFGIGINDSEQPVTKYGFVDGVYKRVWVCPYYRTWRDMLRRCYDDKHHQKHPTYKDCHVCTEWFIFSNFKRWMEQQDWEGKVLDKDLIILGNRLYSSDFCIFVHDKINSFVLENNASLGEYLLGTSYYPNLHKFKTQCRNPLTGLREYLGYYVDELEAHLVWKKRKHELACQLADSEYCNDPRLAEALRTRYL